MCYFICQPYNTYKELTCNFSLWFKYVIWLTGNENWEVYHLEGVILIEHQILQSSSQDNV